MKILLSLSAAVVLLGSIGCEMHPLPQTLKADKKETAEETAAQQKAFTPEAADPNAPSYFKNK